MEESKPMVMKGTSDGLFDGSSDYLATETYVNDQLFTRLDDDRLKIIFNALLGRAESTGIDDIQQNTL